MMAACTNWIFHKVTACYICFILYFIQYSYVSQGEDLEDILSPYKNYREHLNFNRNHRHVRDCQPVQYGNTTFETFYKTYSDSKIDPIKLQTFVKRVASNNRDNFVYGHVVTVSNPQERLSVLEPLESGGCQENKRATVAKSSKQMNCRVAVNAGYFNTHTGSCLGNIVSNGKLVHDAQGIQNANFGILRNGSLVTGYLSEDNVSPGAGNTDFFQLVTGVFWILRNGSLYIKESFQAECKDTEETGTLKKFANVLSARTALGHDKYGNVIIVQVDGKTNHRGMNIYDFASLLQSFGMVNAINLDGGGSATFVVNGTVVNYPSDVCNNYLCARQVSTILCVHDLKCQPADCNGHGKCDIKGQCICDQPWTGPSCSQKEYNESLHSDNKQCNISHICSQPEWTGKDCSEALSVDKPHCDGNSSDCTRNATTKTLIKRFLLRNYAWLDALLGVSLIVNVILLAIMFCGRSSNRVPTRKSPLRCRDDQERLLTATNYDDDEI